MGLPPRKVDSGAVGRKVRLRGSRCGRGGGIRLSPSTLVLLHFCPGSLTAVVLAEVLGLGRATRAFQANLFLLGLFWLGPSQSNNWSGVNTGGNEDLWWHNAGGTDWGFLLSPGIEKSCNPIHSFRWESPIDSSETCFWHWDKHLS